MKSQPVPAHCNTCDGERNHVLCAVEGPVPRGEFEGDSFRDVEDVFELLKCCGCDTVHLRQTSTHRHVRHNDGRPYQDTACYPPKIARRRPRWTLAAPWLLNPEMPVVSLYDEVLKAMSNDTLRLAMMGMRALIEQAAIEHLGADQKTFRGNLEALRERGHITPSDLRSLQAAVEGGHATIHRGYLPSRYEANVALDVTEALLEALYVAPHRAKALEERIPKRRANSASLPDQEL